jgi:hypothetical protein
MPEYELTCSSTNREGVRAKLVLQCEAEGLEEATSIIRGCLPGADWGRWNSTFGILEVNAARREEEQARA